jgi:hypothetical protein
VWVEFSSLIVVRDVDLGQITETLDLPVQGRLDKVDSGESTVGNDSGVVTGFCLSARVALERERYLRTHQATSYASVLPMTEFGSGGAKRQLHVRR